MFLIAVILRRMSDLEKPLCLRLLWGGGDIRHSFSLQENETGDIVVSQTYIQLYQGGQHELVGDQQV